MNTFNGGSQKACAVCDYRDEKVRNIYPDETPYQDDVEEVDDLAEQVSFIFDMLELARKHGMELEVSFKRPE